MRYGLHIYYFQLFPFKKILTHYGKFLAENRIAELMVLKMLTYWLKFMQLSLFRMAELQLRL
jgi:hypothetical protein